MIQNDKFEDLPAWQKARSTAKRVDVAIGGKYFYSNSDRGQLNKILRAALSIVSNIAEEVERHANKNFIYFLEYARASAGKVRAQLYIPLDYISEGKHELLINALSRQITEFMQYLERNSSRGTLSNKPARSI